MKKETAKAQQASLINEEYDKKIQLGMSEMEAQARIQRLIQNMDKRMNKGTSSAKKAKASEKRIGNLSSLGITSLGDPIV